MPNPRTLAPLALTLTLLAAAAPARDRDAPTAPGTYHDWNEDLDEVVIVETFHLADYQRVVVADFATDGVSLPDRDDNTFAPVQEVLADVAGPLADGLREELSDLTVERQQGSAPTAAGVLLLRGEVLELDPGSRAARYWAGFGAGAARCKLHGEIVDAASGRVLLRWTQERRSGVGVGGGKYVNLLQRSLRKIGEDLGAGLRQF